MKKLLRKTIAAVLSIATLVSTAITLNVNAKYEPMLLYGIGDVNSDGYVTENDAKIIFKWYVDTDVAGKVGWQYVRDEWFYIAGDVNLNGSVSIDDAQEILIFLDFCQTWDMSNKNKYFVSYLKYYKRYSGITLREVIKRDVENGPYRYL